MPEPPPVNLFTRHVLENPWPAGIALIAAAAIVAYLALRQGALRRFYISIAVAALGALLIVLGSLITTAGEHARTVTRALVEAATTNDLVTAVSLLDPGVTLHIGLPQNPGMTHDTIVERLGDLAASYAIESNSITHLQGYTESRDAATVHLACSTIVHEFPYPNLSQWVLRVERAAGPQGEWKVTKITWITLNTRTPPSSGW